MLYLFSNYSGVGTSESGSSTETIAAALDELIRDRSAMSLEAATRERYLLLKHGVKASVPVPADRGGQKPERLPDSLRSTFCAKNTIEKFLPLPYVCQNTPPRPGR